MKSSVLIISSRLVAVALSLPLIAIITSMIEPATDIWNHLFQATLRLYISQSLALGIGVIIGTAIIGTTAAILCSLYDFPGKKIFDWGMILPFVFPVYIAGYALSLIHI